MVRVKPRVKGRVRVMVGFTAMVERCQTPQWHKMDNNRVTIAGFITRYPICYLGTQENHFIQPQYKSSINPYRTDVWYIIG